ncbi:Gfo/Idh/MocA family protein [Sinomonas sp. G460-2]|uniref:Gfo/Idh/MocA family protein n=1 Tax=Sinomonas sp. G460-2 TaxID=3393464 RepID=UPI0039EE4847
MSESRGPVGIAVVGTGSISPEYLRNLTAFPDVEVRWVVGRDQDRAAARAAEFAVPRYGSLEDAIKDDSVEIVVNLATPAAHLEVGLAALDAGKHVWSEKPLAVDPQSARTLMQKASECGLRVSVAPDTTLGPALQSARAAIDRGEIGHPVYATTSFESSGPEMWHPDPEFLYEVGAGPLYDVGPYFIGGLVHLLGTVSRVSAAATRGSSTRVIASGPKAGSRFPVLVPTTVIATLEFENGAIAGARFSFDSIGSGTGNLDVIGTDGLLSALSHEQLFDHPGKVRRRNGEAVTLQAETTPFRRGLGVIDLARSIREAKPDRTPGELGLHVLEVLAAIDEASRAGESIAVESKAPLVASMDSSWDPMVETLGRDRGKD